MPEKTSSNLILSFNVNVKFPSKILGSMDRTARLWHLEYTFPLRIYAGHEKDVDVVRFHPNCNYLATAGADKTVRLWSHADAKMVRPCTVMPWLTTLTSNGHTYIHTMQTDFIKSVRLLRLP